MLTPKLLIIQNDRVKKITRYEMYNVPLNKVKQVVNERHSYDYWYHDGQWRWIDSYTAGLMGLYHDHNQVYSTKQKPRFFTYNKKSAKDFVHWLLKNYSKEVKVEVWLWGSLTKKFTLRRK